MAGGVRGTLQRWRENYYLSHLLASVAKPLHFPLAGMAETLQRKVRRNGFALRLPNGKNLIIGRDTCVSLASALFWHGLDGFEPHTSRTLRFFFERAATFIDVGANCGLYSLLGALWNPELQVTAFEPVPAIFDSLKRNVRLNHLEDRIHCQKLALSSQSGKANLFLPVSEGSRDMEGTGTLVAESWQAKQGSPTIEVRTLRFDDYDKLYPSRVDLMKIDVEDFEADVLQGMEAVMRRDRPFIVCEILPRAHRNRRTLQALERVYYRPYWITPMGYIKIDHFDFDRPNLMDFVLSPVSTADTLVQDLQVLWDLNTVRHQSAVTG